MPEPSDSRRRPAAPPPHRRARLSWALGLSAFAMLALLGLALINPDRTLTTADWAQVGYGIGFIVLVASSLAARQLQLGQTIRYALLWLALFALLLVGYAFFVQRAERNPDLPLVDRQRDLTVTLSDGRAGWV